MYSNPQLCWKFCKTTIQPYTIVHYSIINWIPGIRFTINLFIFNLKNPPITHFGDIGFLITVVFFSKLTSKMNWKLSLTVKDCPLVLQCPSTALVMPSAQLQDTIWIRYAFFLCPLFQNNCRNYRILHFCTRCQKLMIATRSTSYRSSRGTGQALWSSGSSITLRENKT